MNIEAKYDEDLVDFNNICKILGKEGKKFSYKRLDKYKKKVVFRNYRYEKIR